MKSTGFLRRNAGCFQFLIKVFLLLVFFYIYRYELRLLWSLVMAVPRLLQDQPLIGLPPANQLLLQIMFIAFNIAGALLFALLIVYLIGGAVLPVRTAAEQWEAMQLYTRLLRGHRAPLIRVSEGLIVKDQLGRHKAGSGAAIVDLNSAIVLERQTSAPANLSIPMTISQATTTTRSRPIVRVGAPGLTFIRRSERLRGVVSLRVQACTNPGVLGYTSDGIEVKTNVVAVFTLGQPATTIKVAYSGKPTFRNLRVLNLDPETQKIQSVSDELDDADKHEIHAFALQFLAYRQANIPLEPLEKSQDFPPYPIDEGRIFAAVYSRARHVNESKVDDWSSLPALVATEIFRNLISQVAYDSLYVPDDPAGFPLQAEFKPAFDHTVRYQGVVSYQFVHRLDGQPPEEGQRVDNRLFRLAPAQDLRASKVLRDRGIKVLHAGFSELEPTDPKIRLQRLDNWRARWQKEAESIKANLDLEAVRIKNHARAEKQREMINALSQIINTSAYPEEALTLRIFQLLEDIAVEPSTRQLLPADTIQVLNGLRTWLLPEDQPAPPALLEGRLSSPPEGALEQEEGYVQAPKD
jgi:hypothetical protein